MRETQHATDATDTPQRQTPSLLRDRLLRRQVGVRACYALGVLGFALRVVLWQASEGTNDIRTWARFAQEVSRFGIGATYRVDPLFNHPPLMGLLASATWTVSSALGVSFAKVFKLYGLLADLGSACLLASIWRRRGKPELAAQSFAGYGCALCAILISGYHGNTDPVYWLLVLCAASLLEDRRAPLWAGFVLGASLHIKLIPLLAILPLAACCRDRSAAVRFVLGGAIALVPFATWVLSLDGPDRAGFVRNVFGYTSYREYWGLELLVRALTAATQSALPNVARVIEACGAFYAAQGSKILLAATGLLAWAHAMRNYRGLDAYAMAALSFCLFVVLASGFGVQYLGAPVPLLFACRVRDGLATATASGFFIGLIYLSFVRAWDPIFSQHSYFSPAFAVPSFIAWWLFLRAACRLWRTRLWPTPYHH